MLTTDSVFILRKSDNYSVNLFSNRNMNSTTVILATMCLRISYYSFIHLFLFICSKILTNTAKAKEQSWTKRSFKHWYSPLNYKHANNKTNDDAWNLKNHHCFSFVSCHRPLVSKINNWLSENDWLISCLLTWLIDWLVKSLSDSRQQH